MACSKYLILFFCLLQLGLLDLKAQKGYVVGQVISEGAPLAFVNVQIEGTTVGAVTDSLGRYKINGLSAGSYSLQFSFVGFVQEVRKFNLQPGESLVLNVELKEDLVSLSEVVVTGTMKEITRMESSVPVEVYSPRFFRKNPTPNIYESLQPYP